MNSGMYAAVSGNIVSMQRMEIISNKLANTNTVGFKKDRMASRSPAAGALEAELVVI